MVLVAAVRVFVIIDVGLLVIPAKVRTDTVTVHIRDGGSAGSSPSWIEEGGRVEHSTRTLLLVLPSMIMEFNMVLNMISPLFEDVETCNRLDRSAGWIVEW